MTQARPTRNVLWLTALTLIVCGMASGGEAFAASRPNILLIMADDQSYHDVGCYGNPDVQTPHLDQLARQGLRFTHCFTATAMCAPTRQQLYTGVFPVRNGAYPNHSQVYSGTKSLVHHFRELGYRVGLHGKRHFGPPDSFPFEMVPKGKLKSFLERDSEQPFLLVYTSNSPHLPWSEGDASQYDADKLQLPPYLVDTAATRRARTRYYAEITDFDREVGRCMKLIREAGAEQNTIFVYTSEQGSQFPHGKWTCYDAGLRTALIIRWPAGIAAGQTTDAMVQYVDLVPTLLDAVGGEPDKADTGRPGAADGGSGFDGRSFRHLFDNPSAAHHEFVYGVHTTRGIIDGSPCYPVRSVRNDRYKLIWNPKHEEPFQNILVSRPPEYWRSWQEAAKTDPKAARLVKAYQYRPEYELYDLQADPYELENLAGNADLKDVQAALTSQLQDWMQQQGDEGIATELEALTRQKRKGN